MPTPSTASPSRQAALIEAERWLPRVLAIASIGFILLFLYTSLRRAAYPFSFDQIEGGMVTSVWRVAHGLPLYSRPTLDFFPYLYAPLYFYLAAGLSKVVGAGYISLRLVSILGTVGSFAVIFALIHAETRSRLASLAGAGLYASCYFPLQAWFDLGRVDSLFVFLLLLAIYCTRHAPVLIAVLVWLVAFQVKQTILPIAVLVFLADWQRPRRMATGLASVVAGIAASILLMNHLTQGWYSYYLFGTAKGLGWILRGAVLYLPTDLLQPFGLAWLVLLASLLALRPRLRGQGTQFFLVVSFSIYASIWYLRSHAGSSSNTLMPAYAWTAVLFGIAFARLRQYLLRLNTPQAQIGRVLVLAAASAQIIGFIYHPGRFDPSVATRDARFKFEQQLSSLPGDIFVLNHSYDALLAGKQPHAVIDAFGILQDSPPSPLRTAYLTGFNQAVDSHRYGGFVLDDTYDTYKPGQDSWMPSDFSTQYPVRLLAESSSISGIGNQPVERWIYLPCSALDGDTSGFINPASIISYASCPNAPTLAHK